MVISMHAQQSQTESDSKRERSVASSHLCKYESEADSAKRCGRSVIAFPLFSLLALTCACGPSDPTKKHSQPLAECIPSGTEDDINGALAGSGAEAVLCPGAVFTLRNPVR